MSDLVDMEQLRSLVSSRDYRTAIDKAESFLPHLQNPKQTSEVHLLIGKCYKHLEDIKSAITSANSAISAYSKWQEPFLFRSVCFQSFHTKLLDTDGDCPEIINQDRISADIIVDPQCENSTVVEEKEEDSKSKLRSLFRKQEKSVLKINNLQEALRIAREGNTIFIEPGVYTVSSEEVNSLFVHGKSLTLIGASSRGCRLIYKTNIDETNFLLNTNSKLETFLLAVNSSEPCIIKRLTFKNENPSTVPTKFLGIAGGTIQLEDCILEGSDWPDVDPIYTNSQICGTFSASYPPPYLILRFCVIDRCEGPNGITANNSCLNIKNTLFIGGGLSTISAQKSSKVTVENCEFSAINGAGVSILGDGSDVTIIGSYFHGLQPISPDLSDLQPACQISNSVARITNNYFYSLTGGLSIKTSEVNCYNNTFSLCSNRLLSKELNNNNILISAIKISGKGKVQLTENLIKQSDVGVNLYLGANSTIRNNVFDTCYFAGAIVQDSAKPILGNNIFNGGFTVNQMCRGAGILYLTGSAGMCGKNHFQDYMVAPLLVFTNCKPLIKDNSYTNVIMNEDKQAQFEIQVINQFPNQVEEESLFYLVDSENQEIALSPVILKGNISSVATE